MIDQQFEDLAKRWPDLFEKSRAEYFSIGEGWIPIIDTLCGLISQKVESAKQWLKYVSENPTFKFNESIEQLIAKVAKETEDLPIISQVKEKYGTLRFYVDGGTDEHRNYIDFAEAMSRITCEDCGSPGQSRNSGWVKTLCDRHHRENQDRSSL
jgi:hypothetical protein